MADQNEEAKQGHPRGLFPHEAHDFTPWLAKNLHRLGEELGLSLKLKCIEKQVGPYFLDILAEEIGNGRLVAIENQLRWTNIHHLGQLLTYATGCNTQSAIWVATEFRYEHAQALHMLNQWTVDDVSFYGVKIEAVRPTPGSEPEPRFRKVVWPGNWNKELTRPRGEKLGHEYEVFFRPLVTELTRTGFTDQPPYKRWGHSGRFFRSRRNSGISYAPSLTRDAAWVTLHIETKDNALTKQIFDALEADRQQIESAITTDRAFEWRWNRRNKWSYSSINVGNEGSTRDETTHDEIRDWMLDVLHKLQNVFDPRIEKILKEAQTPDMTAD